jgi:hypothetical protein
MLKKIGPATPLNTPSPSNKSKKNCLSHQRRLHLLEHRRRDCFGVRFYLNTIECTYTCRVKNVQHHHLLHVILQRHHFVEVHMLLSIRINSSYSLIPLTTVRNLCPLFDYPSCFLPFFFLPFEKKKLKNLFRL